MKFRLVSWLIYWFARLIARTLRLQVIGEERVSAARGDAGGGVILVSWHGRSFVPITLFGGRRYWTIVSTSRDGEYQNQIFRRFGYQIVRGSTSARGAVQAALAMTRQLQAGATLAFTPDGPRGPSRQVQPGAIFLAQKSGCPIIPAGVSASPCRLMPTWDRYLLPLPFARAVLIYGDPILVPPEARSEEERQWWAEQVGAAINRLEDQADRIVRGEKGVGTSPSDAGRCRQA